MKLAVKSSTGLLVIAVFTAATLPAAGQQPEYAGSEICGACHQGQSESLPQNPHHVLESDKKRGWEGRSCEACHGPGVTHVQSNSPNDILNPLKAPPAQTNGMCLKCHLNQPTHAGRILGAHGKNEVSCASCHSMHQGPQKVIERRISDINKLCAGCHDSTWAEFQRPYRHRLPEGAMSCVDCHNPHGSLLPRSQQAVFGNEPGCFKCHGDKRGPFAFEHAPVRLEGCASCHQPHGSANPRMLIRSEQRFLCLECHANVGRGPTIGEVPPGFHDIRSARFQNCTICHTKIHGSHVDRRFLR